MSLLKKIIAQFKLIADQDERDYRIVRDLRLFDSDYYFRFFSEPVEIIRDPLLTYFLQWRAWQKQHRSLSRSWHRLPDPHPLFDTCHYLLHHFPHGLRRNPFAHYLIKGWKRGWSPSPYFDPDLYRQRSSWDGKSGDPLSHYRDHGAPAGISPSAFFDTDWYLDRTPVLVDVRGWLIRHYKMFGAQNGLKSPVPVFDPGYYLQQMPESEAAKDDPLAHYATSGEKGDRRPAALFDPRYYRKRYLHNNKKKSPLAHYLSYGVYLGHYTDERVAALSKKPLISILVPVYNADLHHLDTCIRSVVYQAYPHWELCLVDDCSSDEGVRQLLNQWKGRDERIKVSYHFENKGISGTTATAAALASGTFLGFLDHDDALTPDCLYHVVKMLNATGAPVVYSDEVLVGDDGTYLNAFYKPAFNRNLLYSHNYITHFVVMQATLFHKIGGIGRGYDGAQDFDLLLRAAEATDGFAHIPKILYQWRAVESSSSIIHDAKPYAHEAGKRALQTSLDRQGIEAEVLDNHLNFHYRIEFSRKSNPQIAIVCWREAERRQEGLPADQLIRRAGYDNCNLLVVGEGEGARQSGSLGKAGLLDRAIRESRGEYIALLGAGASEISKRWLDIMAGTLFHDDRLGMVCGRISWAGADGPSYTVPNIDDSSSWYFAEALASMTRHLNGLHNPQLVRCCDYRCCLFKKSLYEQLGGFDQQRFPLLLAMHDFSFKVIKAGRLILYSPQIIVSMKEPGPANPNERDDRREKQLFQQQWRQLLQEGDPYYNTGRLIEQGISESRFLAWLAGDGQESLDARKNLH